MWTNIGRAVRFLRNRKGWTQGGLGARAGLSREAVSRLERGAIEGLTVGAADRIATALGATLSVQLKWQGEQLDRLMDSAHAALQQEVATLLTHLGWIVRVEVSFNHYGDRGRVDLLAFHPIARALVVVEIKSAVGDVQETLGRLDIKVRLARQIASDLGWRDIAAVIPALAIGGSRRARRVVAEHEALFERYAMRGRQALQWLRRPSTPMPPGLLWFVNSPNSHQVTTGREKGPLEGPDSHQA